MAELKALGDQLREKRDQAIAFRKAVDDKERKIREEPFQNFARKWIAKFSKSPDNNPLFASGVNSHFILKINLRDNHLEDGLMLADEVRNITLNPGDRHHPPAEEQIKQLFDQIYKDFLYRGGGKLLRDFCIHAKLEFTARLELPEGIIHLTIKW